MKQRIRNGAVVLREGRLLLVRGTPAGEWELPGGLLQPEHPDVDAAMDLMLQELGIEAPAVEEDYVETIYLQDADGHIVFNVYAPTEWRGEPRTPAGTGSGWFSVEELEAIVMNETVRRTVQVMFGLAEPRDDAAEVLAALGGAMEPEGTLTIADIELPPGREARNRTVPKNRREAGLDVLGTLRGSDAEAAFGVMQRNQPGLAEDIVDFAMGEVWSNPALDRKTRSLQVVAMLSALGRTTPLRSHLNGALNHGVTPDELVQTMRMVAVYAGFPAAVEAWAVMDAVFTERGIAMPGRPQ